uniref:Uncharacterized protein n=1 Tax=Oryza nivara TaxID=4536 RepID=A0A0E0HZE4_ORYNI
MARGRAALLIPPLKLGEEGPGQDLHASCLSMNQVEIKFLFYLYDAIPFLEDCFHEPPKDWSHVPRSHSKIAMSVPVLNQSSSAPFQAIIGITSKTFYSLQSQGAISFSQVKSDTEAVS